MPAQLAIKELGEEWLVKHLGHKKEVNTILDNHGKVSQSDMARKYGCSTFIIRKVLSAAGKIEPDISNQHHNRQSVNSASGYGTKQVECKCPNSNCNKKHKMTLYWVGKLPAPKLCSSCRGIHDVEYRVRPEF